MTYAPDRYIPTEAESAMASAALGEATLNAALDKLGVTVPLWKLTADELWEIANACRALAMDKEGALFQMTQRPF